MRRIFSLLFLVALLAAPSVSHAGFGPPIEPLLLEALPQPEPVEPPRCNMGGGGVSAAHIVARDTGLLAKKFATIPVGPAKTCKLDDERIAVQRYAEYGTYVVLVATLNGENRLVYDPSRAQNGLVRPDIDTWPVDNCPGGTVEWLQQEMLRRLYACYPEPGYRVTSLAADKAAEKAREAAAIEAAKGPKKNPGI